MPECLTIEACSIDTDQKRGCCKRHQLPSHEGRPVLEYTSDGQDQQRNQRKDVAGITQVEKHDSTLIPITTIPRRRQTSVPLEQSEIRYARENADEWKREEQEYGRRFWPDKSQRQLQSF